jgi:cardiolipin synthase (CMP-forming)
MLNVPNFLTLLRLVAIPVFLIFLLDGRYGTAFGVFVAAGITDALDGAIARLTHTKTALGAYLDPAADKLLLLSALIALAFGAAIPRWLVIVVISRDVIVVLGFFILFVMTGEAMEVRPTVVGKLATFFQLMAVSLVLFSLARGSSVLPALQVGVFYVAGVLTAAAGAQYVYRGLQWLQGQDTPGPDASSA